MKFQTKGIILRQQNIGEQDRLVWILSDSHGVIRAFVRRAQNLKSPKCASTGLLCYSKLSVYEGKDSYSVDEAEAVEQFKGLRSDPASMALAQYFCELCLTLCPKEQKAEEELRLLLNSLYLLSNRKKPPTLIKICFEMRLISMCGYMPDLVMCDQCGKYESDRMLFRPENGKLYCEDCMRERSLSGALLPIAAVTALRHTVYADSERLFSFELKDELMEMLSSLTERYISNITSKDFLTLSIYKTLKG